MFTESYVFARQVAGRERLIEVDADLLTVLWNAFEGPQTPEDIVNANLRFIDDLIRDFADPESDDRIVLTGVDYETEEGDEFERTRPIQ